ncbi:MAG TPA: serine hydrolase domain-containing protein [Candidatus Baltobacteraceae bacterium]|nr:serine hydrolase domain-containing protein [Candidatus Baltobacteraceae bacterium]
MLPAALLAASLALTPAQSAKIDAVVAQVMQSSHIRGLSLGVSRKGHVVFLRGYGMRRCMTNAPVDGYTVFRVGSVTKQFTAALVLEEADRSALPLNAEVDGITIAELLSQTSGLLSYTDPGETLDRALDAPTQFTPGTRWQYSNSNYYLLGTALQSVTKLSFSTLLADRITKPLNLASTMLGVPLAENVARGCAWDGSQWELAAEGPNDSPALAFSASGMSSNVPDLLTWLWNLYDGTIIAQDSFDQMTRSWTLADGTPTNYGFGFFTDRWYGLPVAQHPGYVDGFSAEDALVLNDGTAIAILSNADQVPLVPLAKSLVEIVEPLKDHALVATISQPAIFEDPRITALVRNLIAELTAGTIDRSLLSENLSLSLDDRRARSYAQTLAPLGKLEQAFFNESTIVGEVTSETYTLVFAHGRLMLHLDLRDGKVDDLALDAVR